MKGHKFGKRDSDKGSVLAAKIVLTKDVLPALEAASFPVKKDGKHVVSHLGPLKKPMSYSNEADVQFLIGNLMHDAIRVLGLEDHCEMHMEMSLFSNVPDMVVVRNRGHVVMCSEVKSPEIDGGEVFESRIVAYQVFCYLMVMRQLGHDAPVACLTTYNQICMATLDDPTEHTKFVSDKAMILKQLTQSGIQEPNPRSSIKEKPHVSPLRKHIQFAKRCIHAANIDDHPKTVPTGSVLAPDSDNGTDSAKLDVSATKDDSLESFESEMEVLDPVVTYGPRCAAADVFQNMCKILLLAYIRCQHLDISDNLAVVSHNDRLGERVFPRVDETSCVWVKTGKKFTTNAKKFPSKSASRFLLLAPLGQGGTGKVLLASSTSGLLCAVKLYIPERSTSWSHEERKENIEENMEEKTKVRDAELERWKQLYTKQELGKRKSINSQSVNSLNFRKAKLNGLPALLLPYGQPLDTVEARLSKLGEIEKKLNDFASSGFFYKNSDLRWRHVAILHSGELILLDLESLNEEKNMSSEKQKDLVKAQIKELRSRAGKTGKKT